MSHPSDEGWTSRPVWNSLWRRRMEAPLVNEYKQPFIWRRLLQTFLGGLRFSMPGPVPIYAYLLQIILFIPLGIGLGAFLAMEDRGSLYTSASVLGCAVWTTLYCLAVMFMSFVVQKQQTQEPPGQQVTTSFDEEMPVFDGALGPSTWGFLVPGKGGVVVSVAHALMAGVTSAAMAFCLSVRSVARLLHLSGSGAVALSTLGVWSTCLSLWGLVAAPPPEPAVFAPLLPYHLAAFSRPAHLLCAALIHLLHWWWPAVSWLWLLNYTTHVVVALLSLLWCLAALPPLDALLLWLLEQWHVLVLGCSPCASNRRLYWQCAAGTASLVLLSALPSRLLLLLAAALRGVVLGLDYYWLVRHCVSACRRGSVGLARADAVATSASGSSSRLVGVRREGTGTLLLWLLVCVTCLAILLPHRHWMTASSCGAGLVRGYSLLLDEKTDPPPPSIFNFVSLVCCGISWCALWLVWWALGTSQQVWSCGGLIRNCFAPNPPLFSHYSIRALVCKACSIGGPMLLLVGTLVWTGADRCGATGRAFSSAWFLHVAVLARVFTLIWTSQWQCCGALCVFFLLEVVLPLSPAHVPGYLGVGVAVRMTLCSVGLLWLRRALHHCLAICIITYSSIVDKKQRRPITLILAAVNIGLMPALVLLAAAAAVLNAPLLPVFTLPCFLLGFPRPHRFWPYTASHTSATTAADSAYYAQLAPHLLSQLFSCLHSGALGLVMAGDHFLVRFEDRLVWIQVLEVGCGYVYLSIKGLELQETSCHTVEASKVDAMFSRAFDEPSQALTSSSRLENSVNPFFLHTLTPLCQLPLFAYSDTQNVLTGVIDSNDFLSVINEYFVKCLLFVVMNYAITVKQGCVAAARAPSRQSNSGRSRHSIASASYDLLSSLPKLSDAISRQSDSAESGNPLAGEEPNCSQDTSRPKDGKCELGDEKDSKSLQSGRGSRLAWVDKSKLNSTIESRQDWEQDIFDLSSDKLVMNPDGLKMRSSSQAPVFSRIGSRLSLNRDFPPIAGKSQNFVLTPPNASPVSDCEPRRSRSNSTAIQLQQQRHIRHQSIDLSEDMDVSPTLGEAPGTIMTVTSVKVLPRPDVTTKAPPSARLSKSGACTLYGPPLSWLDDLPYDPEVVDNMQAFFPLSWFKFLLTHFVRSRFEAQHHNTRKSSSLSQRKLSSKSRIKSGSQKLRKSSRKKLSGSSGGKRSAALEKYGSVATDAILPPGPTDDRALRDDHRVLQKLLEDEALEEAYRVVSAVCSMLLCGGCGEDPALPSPHQVYCTFRGAFLSSTKLLWLNERPLLRTFVLKAYRMAVKISLDHVLIGLNSSSWPDLMEALTEYNSTWFFGSDESDTNTTNRRSAGRVTDEIRSSSRLLSNPVDGGATRRSREEASPTVNERIHNIPDASIGRRSLDEIDRVNNRSLDANDGASMRRSLEATDALRTRRSHDSADRVRRSSLSLLQNDGGDLDASDQNKGPRGEDHSAPGEGQEATEPLQRQDEPQSWVQAIQREVPHLFSIGYNDVKRVYTSRLASLRVQEAGLGRLNSSVVTGVWGALSPELLYLTNDDDERYSIQAHASLLRNLTVQAADPPLGYPVYSSPPLRVGASSLLLRPPTSDAGPPPS